MDVQYPQDVQQGSGSSTQPSVLGIVWPDTGDAIEQFEMASATRLNEIIGSGSLHINVDFSRGPPGHTVEKLHAVGEIETIAAAGRRLVAQGAGAVVWACTSGSFIGGLEWSRAQQNQLHNVIGRPVVSGLLALISSVRRLGFSRLDVLSPYPDDVTENFCQCLHDAGLEVATVRTLHSSGATASARLSLVDECRAFANSENLDADAVIIPDTAVNSLTCVEALEAALRSPVLTVNQACIFEGAALLGLADALASSAIFRRFGHSGENAE